MKITEILMAEHAVFHNLFDHVEATVPQLRTLAEVKSLGQIIAHEHPVRHSLSGPDHHQAHRAALPHGG